MSEDPIRVLLAVGLVLNLSNPVNLRTCCEADSASPEYAD